MMQINNTVLYTTALIYAALYNAVCLQNAFFANYFCKCFLFSCFVLVYRHIVCLSYVIIYVMHSAFNLLVFPYSMFTPLFFYLLKGLCALRRNSTYK